MVANGDPPDNLGTRPKINVIADDGNSWVFPSISYADCDIVIKIAVLSDSSLPVDNDTAEVTDVQARADLRVVRDVDAKSEPIMIQDNPADDINRKADESERFKKTGCAHPEGVIKSGGEQQLSQHGRCISSPTIPVEITCHQLPIFSKFQQTVPGRPRRRSRNQISIVLAIPL